MRSARSKTDDEGDSRAICIKGELCLSRNECKRQCECRTDFSRDCKIIARRLLAAENSIFRWTSAEIGLDVPFHSAVLWMLTLVYITLPNKC